MKPITNCMRIQRYLTIDWAEVEIFGEHYKECRWDFDWYIGDNKIGVTGNFSIESEDFISGILVEDDELIITPSQKIPSIKRVGESYAVIGGNDGGLEEVGELIKLIQGNDVTHMYLSSGKPKGRAKILTFSPTEPSKELYKKGKILPVSINEDAVKQELELEQMLSKMN